MYTNTVCVYVYICSYVCVCMYACVYVYVCMHVYVYICMYMCDFNITASTGTSVTLSWMPPDPSNGPLSVYQVTYNEEGSQVAPIP